MASLRGLPSLDPVTWPVDPEEFWDVHGSSLYALACALLGDESAALRAVALAMTDGFKRIQDDAEPAGGDTFREVAQCVYWRCQGTLAERPACVPTMTSSEVLARLGELADVQRSCLALCVFGGHTHREAAALLGMPLSTIDGLLISGLRELLRPGPLVTPVLRPTQSAPDAQE